MGEDPDRSDWNRNLTDVIRTGARIVLIGFVLTGVIGVIAYVVSSLRN